MGVDYKAGFGYGFTLSDEDTVDENESLDEYADRICQEFNSNLLEPKDYISYIFLGNAYSGEQVVLIGYVKSISGFKPEKIDLHVPTEEQIQLLQLLAFAKSAQQPQWYAGMYVF